MKARIAKLIDVKTIVTFALTGAFVFLAVRERVEPKEFMTIYTMVICFYFGTQFEKHKNTSDKKEEDK
jgi:hypothetical protein